MAIRTDMVKRIGKTARCGMKVSSKMISHMDMGKCIIILEYFVMKDSLKTCSMSGGEKSILRMGT